MATPDEDLPVPASIYHPLNSGNYEIRMLTILPADDAPTSIVSCKLETTTLFDTTKYAALSYCWGNPNITKDIIVENIVTPVTINLGNALFHLRSMKVTRIWVDALCINQKDNQEKSYQIRNMKHLYEKADVTYSWLGSSWTPNPGMDSMSAMTLLRAMFLEENHAFLTEIEHSQDYSILPSASTAPDLHQNCQRCLVDFQFRSLREFFNLDYWHRCWIIQEVSAASRIQIIYGNECMTWEEMVTAIQRCRQSCYWSDEIGAAFLCLAQIMEFRLAYQREKRPLLCEAIIKSRKFQSTDLRDRIFALLGISADGTELVQTPNYLQALGIISRDVTRSLVRKHGRLELIVLGKNTTQDAHRTTREELPTWSPNWFSLDLPAESHLVAGLTYVTKHSIVSDIVSRHGDTLEVEGMCIGRIVDATTTLVPGMSPQSGPFPLHQPRCLGHQITSYYRNTGNLILALVDCLTIAPWRHDDDIEKEFHHLTSITRSKMFTTYSARRQVLGRFDTFVLHYFYNIIFPRFILRAFHLVWCQSESAQKYFNISSINLTLNVSRWLIANRSFLINGKSMTTWLAEERKPIWPMIIDHNRIQFTLLAILIGVEAVLFYYINVIVHFNVREFTVYLVVLASTTSVAFGLVVVYLKGCRRGLKILLLNYMEISARYLEDSTSPPKKILLFDRGFIGMSFADAQVGDIAYFLLGCHKAVLLREVLIENQKRYKVVGEVSLWLSDQDRDVYKPFVNICGNEMGIPGFPKLWQEIFERKEIYDTEDYYTLIEEYRRNGSLQRLDLI